mmetsp:Transcript_14490/g.25870  ORF Transcript_14490/g.25870 Transcript_14490/m.25870 type:complete len:179 (-) Transcript_14490:103-639(-)
MACGYDPRMDPDISPYEAVLVTFQKFDFDGNGVLTYDELSNLLIGMGFPPFQVPALFNACDLNCDGMIHYEEFLQWVFGADINAQEVIVGTIAASKVAIVRFYEWLLANGQDPSDVFMDISCDGYLSRNELWALFSTSGIFNDRIHNTVFELFDFTGEGWVGYDEFMAMFMQIVNDNT